MPPRPSAQAVIELLGLEPHPTCGYVTETYRSPDRIAAEFPAAAALLDEFLGQ